MCCENEGTVSRGGIYTRLVMVEWGGSTIIGLINPDADLDDKFRMFDIDDNEWLYINGWQADIEDYEHA